MDTLPQKQPRYTFDCTKCHNSLQLIEDIYFEHYRDHELCLSCRPGELPKERLNENIRSDEWINQFEEENKTHVTGWGMVENSTIAPIIASHRAMSKELKRLQSIEAEYLELRAIMDKAKKLAYQSVEGAESNE